MRAWVVGLGGGLGVVGMRACANSGRAFVLACSMLQEVEGLFPCYMMVLLGGTGGGGTVSVLHDGVARRYRRWRDCFRPT